MAHKLIWLALDLLEHCISYYVFHNEIYPAIAKLHHLYALS